MILCGIARYRCTERWPTTERWCTASAKPSWKAKVRQHLGRQRQRRPPDASSRRRRALFSACSQAQALGDLGIPSLVFLCSLPLSLQLLVLNTLAADLCEPDRWILKATSSGIEDERKRPNSWNSGFLNPELPEDQVRSDLRDCLNTSSRSLLRPTKRTKRAVAEEVVVLRCIPFCFLWILLPWLKRGNRKRTRSSWACTTQ